VQSACEVMGVRKEQTVSAKLMCRALSCGSTNATVAEHFNIGKDLIPREMIAAYATLKKAAANANRRAARREAIQTNCSACDEILAGKHEECFLCTSG